MNSRKAKVYILFGGNKGNRFKFFEKAENEIARNVGTVVTKSGLYESEAWGFDTKEEQDFLNQVIIVETFLQPQELLVRTQRIEKKLGRTKKSKIVSGGLSKIPQYEDRNIDIDILFYDDLVLNTSELVIPHPKLH